MTGQEFYWAARAAVENGQLDEAMQLLADADTAGDLDPKLTTNMRHEIAALKAVEGSEPPSVGTSSSTSESKPEPSGEPLPDTEKSSLSHAPTAESLSVEDPQASQESSSSVSSTDGSTPETGPSQPSQSGSSAASTEEPPATPVSTSDPVAGARDLINLARQQFDLGNYDEADRLLNDAEVLDPSVKDEVASAHTAVAGARASKSSFPG